MKRWLLLLLFCVPFTATGCSHDQVCQWLYDHGQTSMPGVTCLNTGLFNPTPVDIP